MLKTITGDDTLVLYDRVIRDLSTDDVSTITFPNDLVTTRTGKNGNTLYAKNEEGNNADVVLRLSLGSDDDKFLNSKLESQNRDFTSFVLAEGQFVKKAGDGSGNITRSVYDLKGGVFSRRVDSKENVSGDTEQAIAVYNFRFAEAKRSLQ